MERKENRARGGGFRCSAGVPGVGATVGRGGGWRGARGGLRLACALSITGVSDLNIELRSSR